MLRNILTISGKPGLYKLVGPGHQSIIVETVDAVKKRFNVSRTDQVVSLNDISVYTNTDEFPLRKVFASILEKYAGAKVELNIKKATSDDLYSFFEEVLPDFDHDRVYPSHVKKIIQWYNILIENDLKDFSDPEQQKESAE
ncbi:MAG: DUF5606 domain-containing protein [Bacteroidaceae bacterium]|nr:DUF5606 domain-containing protein [Bacteroidaceae bacterium]